MEKRVKFFRVKRTINWNGELSYFSGSKEYSSSCEEWPTEAMVRTILVHIGYKLTGQANNLCMFHDPVKEWCPQAELFGRPIIRRNQIGSGDDIPAPNPATELRRGLGAIRIGVWFRRLRLSLNC